MSALTDLKEHNARLAFEDEALVLAVAPDFAAFAASHVDDYEALATQAVGRKTRVRIAAGAAAASAGTVAAAPSPAEESRQRLRQEAEKEPAVQEALDQTRITAIRPSSQAVISWRSSGSSVSSSASTSTSALPPSTI